MQEIERLKKEDISDEELKMIRTRTKANLIRGLGDNEGLATQLAIYQTRYGDWRELFRSVDRIDKVTKADIRRVANQTFQDYKPHGWRDRNRHRNGTRQRTGIGSNSFTNKVHQIREVRSDLETIRWFDDSRGRHYVRAASSSHSRKRRTGSKSRSRLCPFSIPSSRNASSSPTAW